MDKITYKSVVSKLRAKRFWLTTEYDKALVVATKSKGFIDNKTYDESVRLYCQRYSDLRCETTFYASLLGKSHNKLWLSIWEFNANTGA